MFSGIVQGIYEVSHIDRKENFASFSVLLDDTLTAGLEIGASVAINGVCMTVVKTEGNNVFFDAMSETLKITTTGNLKTKSRVNVERSIKYGDEIGGHNVSGHVHGMATITDIDKSDADNTIMSFKVPASLTKFIFDKGFVSLNGASLTVVDIDRTTDTFRVSFIPETLRKTTFGDSQSGDSVNVEVDQQTRVIVETVDMYLARGN